MGQWMQESSRNWRKQKTDTSLEPPEKHRQTKKSPLSLCVQPSKTVPGFDLQNRKIVSIC